MSLNVIEITDDEYGHCAVLSTEDFEVIVSLDYGPRIISAKKNNGVNLIYNTKDKDFDRCHGHKMRLTLERSTNGIYCDDLPVRYSPMSDGVSFMQTIVDPVQLEFSMDIAFNSDIGDFMVIHSCLNKSKEAVKLSIYTETPFCRNGFIFVPQSNINEGDRPSKILTLWNNTKWTDSRIRLGEQYLVVTPGGETDAESRLKIGLNNTAGWCGFTDGNNTFIKRYVHNRTALYPFCHCSTFATSCKGHISIQTTSPFYRIEPGESARHIENWILPVSSSVIFPDDENSIDEFINTI